MIIADPAVSLRRRAIAPVRDSKRASRLAVFAGATLARLVCTGVLVIIALFPNLPRLFVQVPRFLHPELLVDPHFKGSDEAVAGLQQLLARIPAEAPPEARVWAVKEFVRQNIVYAYDWELYSGNLHDWPTAAEVWSRRSDDCDGIAILTASLLRRIGIDAVLEFNAIHCWVRILPPADDVYRGPDTLGGAMAGPTASGINGDVRWLRMTRDFLSARTWSEDFSFPWWRVLIVVAAAAMPWIPMRRGQLRPGVRSEAGSLADLISKGQGSWENVVGMARVTVAIDNPLTRVNRDAG